MGNGHSDAPTMSMRSKFGRPRRKVLGSFSDETVTGSKEKTLPDGKEVIPYCGESYQLFPPSRFLPSLPLASSISSQQDCPRYQETTSVVSDRRKSTPGCNTSPSVLELETDTYASVGNVRPAVFQPRIIQPSVYSSDSNLEAPTTVSSRSLEVGYQGPYEPLNLQRREDGYSVGYVDNPVNFIINPTPRPVVKVLKLQDDVTKKTSCIDDDDSFTEDSRQFVDIPVDAAATYRWKFMTVNTSEIGQNEPSYIRLAYSNNPRDLPTCFMHAFQLLYDGVIHCLPHNQTFSQPIHLSFMLPDSLNLSQLTVAYSNTNVGDATHWTIFGKPEYSQANISQRSRESNSCQNRAVLLADRRELQLVLQHFCIFAILVDGQEEQAQNIAVEAFLKIAVSSFRYTVNVLIVVGCRPESCNERKEMALGKGYIHVEKTEHIMFENAGDLTVMVENISWMNDHVLQPASFTQDKHSLWCGIARPNSFEVTSQVAVRSGVDSSFSCDVRVQQSDRTPLVFRVLQDLHELLWTGSPTTPRVLAHCACQLCGGLASATTAATQHETSTKRVNDAEPPHLGAAAAESLPTQCQPDSNEDNQQLSQPLRSSDSASLCDYRQAAAAKPLDDLASAAARPKIRTLAAVR